MTASLDDLYLRRGDLQKLCDEQNCADNALIELDVQRQANHQKLYRSRSANDGPEGLLIRENENDESGSDDSESYRGERQLPIEDQRQPPEQELQPFEELKEYFRPPMHGAQLSIVVEQEAEYLNDSVEESDNEEDRQDFLDDDQNQIAFIEEIRPE